MRNMQPSERSKRSSEAQAFAGLIVFAVMQAMAELQVNLPRESSFVGYSKEFLGSSVACGIG